MYSFLDTSNQNAVWYYIGVAVLNIVIFSMSKAILCCRAFCGDEDDSFEVDPSADAFSHSAGSRRAFSPSTHLLKMSTENV